METSSRPKHYAKSCFFFKQITKKKIYDYSPEEDLVYDFALEYKAQEAFFEPYLRCDKHYKNKPSFADLFQSDRPTTTTGSAVSWVSGTKNIYYSMEQIKPNEDSICDKCLNADICKYTGFIQKQRCYPICIKNKYVSQEKCQKCGNPVFISKEIEMDIRDARLLGHPVVLRIRRVRGFCSKCNILVGDNQLFSLQAFCDSVMTPRLATAVLRAHISGVKRSYIMEAYGLSASQIDRIKHRMIELVRSRNALNALKAVKAKKAEITPLRFYDSEMNEYFAYFYADDSGEVMLADILTKEQHDWVYDTACESKDLFRDESDLLLASIMVAVGEKRLSWEEVQSFVRVFLSTFPRFDSSVMDKMIGFEYPSHRRLFDLINDKNDSDYYEFLANGETDNELPTLHNQYILKEFYGKADDGFTGNIINKFIIQLSSALNNQRRQRHPKLLFEQLLYYNPAAVSATVLYWFTNERFSGLSLHNMGLQGEVRMSPRWGVPVRCLSFLMKNGLLKQGQHSLLPCYLVRHNYSESQLSPANEDSLPCKMKNIYCVHCHESFR